MNVRSLVVVLVVFLGSVAGVSRSDAQTLLGLSCVSYTEEYVDASLSVRNMQAVRINMSAMAAAEILLVPVRCEMFQSALNRHGHEGRQLIILTIRNRNPNLPEYDYIPPDESTMGELTKQETLQVIEEFFRRFGDMVDYYQVGNEIFGGPGTYWIGDVESGYPLPEGDDADLDEVFTWLDDLAQAARRGDPGIGIISSAINIPTLQAAAYSINIDGEPATTQNRPTAAIMRTIDFGNRYDGSDIHMHTYGAEFLEEALISLHDDANSAWPAPENLFVTEWSMQRMAGMYVRNDPAGCNDYYQCSHGQNTTRAEWDEFIRGWLESPEYGGDMAQFMRDGMDIMSGYGVIAACYGPAYQGEETFPAEDCTGGNTWQLIAVCADTIVEQGTGPADRWSSFIKASLEATGEAFFQRNFDPHPVPNTFDCSMSD